VVGGAADVGEEGAGATPPAPPPSPPSEPVPAPSAEVRPTVEVSAGAWVQVGGGELGDRRERCTHGCTVCRGPRRWSSSSRRGCHPTAPSSHQWGPPARVWRLQQFQSRPLPHLTRMRWHHLPLPSAPPPRPQRWAAQTPSRAATSRTREMQANLRTEQGQGLEAVAAVGWAAATTPCRCQWPACVPWTCDGGRRRQGGGARGGARGHINLPPPLPPRPREARSRNSPTQRAGVCGRACRCALARVVGGEE
jgi:hypothetical protein